MMLEPIFLYCLLATILFLAAADSSADSGRRAVEPVDAYEPRALLPYRLLKPKNYDSQKSYPLVLFLHGLGERGTDNRAQLSNGVAELFANKEARAQFPCFAVVPQCPDGDFWSSLGDPRATGLSMPAQLALAVIGVVRKEFNIDNSRLYIGGISMGGFGTWDIIIAHPNYFAAAFPICGGGDHRKVAVLKDMPIWAFHGAQDEAVNPEFSRRMITAIQQAGGNPRYTEYPDVGHDSWTPAFQEPDLLPWLFSQKKK